MRKLGAGLLGAMAVVAVMLILMEVMLRVLPIVSGVHRQNPPSAHASARLTPGHAYRWSLGWDLRHVVHGRTNDMGFLSPHEYSREQPAIALIGDSFVEAQMLAHEESLAGHLDAHARGKLHTFNFGISGAALPHYLGIAREMGEQFQFDSAVVVVTGSDYEEGFEHKEGMYGWGKDPEAELVSLVPSITRGGVRDVVRSLALVRYFRANLKLTPARLFAHTRPSECRPQALKEIDYKRLAAYVDALPQALRLDPARIVLVFNKGSNTDIYERVDRGHVRADAACPTVDALALTELRKLARARGMKLVDAEEVLEAHYRVSRQALDFKPIDSHWNGLATRIIADEIARQLGLEGKRLALQ